jgi:hypothetical protein
MNRPVARPRDHQSSRDQAPGRPAPVAGRMHGPRPACKVRRGRRRQPSAGSSGLAVALRDSARRAPGTMPRVPRAVLHGQGPGPHRRCPPPRTSRRGPRWCTRARFGRAVGPLPACAARRRRAASLRQHRDGWGTRTRRGVARAARYHAPSRAHRFRAAWLTRRHASLARAARATRGVARCIARASLDRAGGGPRCRREPARARRSALRGFCSGSGGLRYGDINTTRHMVGCGRGRSACRRQRGRSVARWRGRGCWG